ncbi:MAG: hypothetical protein ACI4AM_02470, partial [Muribaculaceae bacterium]
MKALYLTIICLLCAAVSAVAQQPDSIGYSELLAEYESLEFTAISARYGSPSAASAYPYSAGQCLVSDKLDVRLQQHIQANPNTIIAWFSWDVDNGYQLELFYLIDSDRLRCIDGFKHLKSSLTSISHHTQWHPGILPHALSQEQPFR